MVHVKNVNITRNEKADEIAKAEEAQEFCEKQGQSFKIKVRTVIIDGRKENRITDQMT